MICNKIRFLFVLAMAATIVTPFESSAREVNGLEGLYQALVTEGYTDDALNKEILRRAQEFVEKKPLKELKSTAALGKPFDLLRLNQDFFTISFHAFTQALGVKQTGVVQMLFEAVGDGQFIFSNDFLYWFGADEMNAYKKIKPNDFCKYYVSGCKPTVKKATTLAAPATIPLPIAVALAKKAELTHTHMAQDIVAGVFKPELIEKALAETEKNRGEIDEARKESEAYKVEIAALKTEMNNLLAQLKQQSESISQLNNILKVIQVKGNEVVFNKVNVRIVNGSGNTESVNGLGNLIIGYNEQQAGSHNLVVGSKNNYTSYGGIVAGSSNSITGAYANVTGGAGNSASGAYSSVSGGHLNKADGKYSSVSGGLTRKAPGDNGWAAGLLSEVQ